MLGPSSVPVLRGVTAAVYGLLLPETRAMVRRLWAERPENLYERSYDDVQDAAHVVFLDAWRAWVSPLVSGLGEFHHAYVANGSSEAIRESVWSLASAAHSRGLTPQLHVFAGEYEGYAAYARAAGIAVVSHDREHWADEKSYSPQALHRWYISQPSAIDGNNWPAFPEFVAGMAERGVEIAVDLAYVGAAADQPAIDLSLPNIRYVFFSLSKVFGLFYHRVGGTLSRSPMLGLEGNRWFKNMFSLYLGTSLMSETPTLTTLPTRYRHVQLEACQQLGTEHGIPFTPSEVILLAWSPLGPYPDVFRRGGNYRWCLTPTLDALLAAHTAAQPAATHA